MDRIDEIAAWYIDGKGAKVTRLEAIERDIATLLAEIYRLRAAASPK